MSLDCPPVAAIFCLRFLARPDCLPFAGRTCSFSLFSTLGVCFLSNSCSTLTHSHCYRRRTRGIRVGILILIDQPIQIIQNVALDLLGVFANSLFAKRFSADRMFSGKCGLTFLADRPRTRRPPASGSSLGSLSLDGSGFSSSVLSGLRQVAVFLESPDLALFFFS